MSITAEQYQQWVEHNWNRLGFEREPNELRELFIMSVGLGGEAGEVQELLKKHVRDGREIVADLRLELGDVLHYLTRIASQFGMTLEDIMLANRSKIEHRHTLRMEKDRA
jgi:NTP pyrophosphatase (non-canonical NTP hydrolase)